MVFRTPAIDATQAWVDHQCFETPRFKDQSEKTRLSDEIISLNNSIKTQTIRRDSLKVQLKKLECVELEEKDKRIATLVNQNAILEERLVASRKIAAEAEAALREATFPRLA